MLSAKLKEAAGNGLASTLYVDDVFSTWLYTGNGSTQTITNSIDLAGQGGLVWTKGRTTNITSTDHWLVDTARGTNNGLRSNVADGTLTDSTMITGFNSNGYSLGSDSTYGFVNWAATVPYASWTFRKAAKFFDVVTYTGDGTTNKVIPHSLGSVPGMIITKRTDSTGNWTVWHRAYSNDTKSYMYLNLTDALVYAPSATPITIDASSFTIGTNQIFGNGSGWSYVAYLFAHDTSSTGIIQCGSFNNNPSSVSSPINLGWEPQFLLMKNTNSTEDWYLIDNMRRFTANGTIDYLNPNTSSAENAAASSVALNSTGFRTFGLFAANSNIIYMAIRRPNKPPTSGTQVYNAFLSNTSHPGGVPKFNSGFPVDMFMFRGNTGDAMSPSIHPRLTTGFGIDTASTAAETSTNYSSVLRWDYPNGIHDNATFFEVTPDMGWMFKRAPGFFDVVCYTGTGVTNNVNHNLTVVPELVITKPRNSALTPDWIVLAGSIGSNLLVLNSNSGVIASSVPVLTSTTINLNGSVESNQSSINYVAYLFATLAGISKVGSYTGNGSSQNIECGFAAGARFVLIKRTDSTGDWFVWDTARGIVAANDPHLSLNTTAAEVTTDDSIDPYSAGFTVNQVAATNINVSSATYIFLAIA